MRDMANYKCKITVLKMELYEDLQEQYLQDPNSGKCPLFTVGQEIIVDLGSYWNMLDGKFCAYAWDAINKFIYAALQGGSILRGWNKDEKVMIVCCPDGVRPVTFKVERINEGEA
jgi:uncharacterized repeat protein (TIGR04076 family)